jgi:chromosome partitioning protein
VSITAPLGDDTPLARAAEAVVSLRSGRDPLPKPSQTRIVTVANQKGGVGKTTTTVNMAAALALHGQNVLVVDLDPQGNASTALGIEHHEGTPSVYQVVVEGDPLASVVVPVEGFPHLFCAPATLALAGAEPELVAMVAREFRLARALESYLAHHEREHGRLDYVFIDCPPSLGLLTINALAAAREILVPIQCEYYALEGVTGLMRVIELVTKELNPTLVLGAVLLTMYDARTKLSQQVADEVRRHFGELVIRTLVPRSVRVSEAPSFSQTVIAYDPGSPGALSYIEASREFSAMAPSGLRH